MRATVNNTGAPRNIPSVVPLRLICSTVIALLSFTLVAWGQQEAPKNQQTSPQPIAAAEITGRSEQVSRMLQDIDGELAVDPAVARIDSLLPEYVQTFVPLRPEVTVEAVNQASLRGLRSNQEEWSVIARRLHSWRQTLENRALEIDKIRSRLQAMRTEWEVTRSASREEELPQTLRERIATTLRAIDQHEELVRVRRTAILNLLKKVSDESIEADEIVRRIELGMTQYTERLLIQDSRPIWELITSPDEAPPTKGVASVNQKKIDALQQFISQNSGVLYAYALFIIVLATVMVAAKRNAEKTGERSGPDARGKIPIALRRPVSAALFIALLFSRWVIPAAPDVFFKIIGLFMLIPMIRILPLLLPQGFRALPFIVAGVFIFHRIVTLTVDIPDVYRLLLLVLILVAVSAVFWFIRVPLVRGKTLSHRTRRWGTIVSYGAVGGFAIGFLANVLGFSSLSELITDTTLTAIYAAVALVAGLLILQDLLAILISTRIGQALRSVRQNEQYLRRRIGQLLWITATGYWLALVLSDLNLWAPIRDFLLAVFSYQFTVGSVSFSLGSFVAVFITIWISVLLSRLIRFALDADVLPRMNLSKGLAPTISTMVYYTGILFGLLLAASIIGLKWDTLAIIIGALGVGIGFGLQNLVNNVVSGLILMFERPINVGDTIEFGDRFGDVLHIGLRASTVRSFDGAEVIVPNSSLISSEVVNWTLSDRHRRMEVNVGVEYGTDPQRVLDLLLDVARSHPLVMKEPAPFAWFMGFGDSSLDFVVKFWIAQFENAFTTRSEITVAINNALNKAGITIPFPQRDLHLRSVDPSVTKTLGGGGKNVK